MGGMLDSPSNHLDPVSRNQNWPGCRQLPSSEKKGEKADPPIEALPKTSYCPSSGESLLQHLNRNLPLVPEHLTYREM